MTSGRSVDHDPERCTAHAASCARGRRIAPERDRRAGRREHLFLHHAAIDRHLAVARTGVRRLGDVGSSGVAVAGDLALRALRRELELDALPREGGEVDRLIRPAS